MEAEVVATPTLLAAGEAGPFDIRIRSLNAPDVALQVLPDMRVSELKDVLANQTSVPSERQRLIFRGKVLRDEHPLTEYAIESGHTVHLVPRPEHDRQHHHQPQQEQASGQLGSGPPAFPILPDMSSFMPSLGYRVDPRGNVQQQQQQQRQRGRPSDNAPPQQQRGRPRYPNAFAAPVMPQPTPRMLTELFGIGGESGPLRTLGGPGFAGIAAIHGAPPTAWRRRRSGGGATEESAQPAASDSAGFPGSSAPTASSPESLEHIRQGLLTVHTLLSSIRQTQEMTDTDAEERPVHFSTTRRNTDPSAATDRDGEGSFQSLASSTEGEDGQGITSSGDEQEMLVNFGSSETDTEEMCDFDRRDSMPNSTESSSSPSEITEEDGDDDDDDDDVPGLVSDDSEIAQGDIPPGLVSDSDEEEEEEEDDFSFALEPTVRPPPSAERTAPRRQFYVGQWLDVKDTVNQWLEATVMDVRTTSEEGIAELLIHYNGWPPRWDEWIACDSPRLAPFCTRTSWNVNSNATDAPQTHLSPASSYPRPPGAPATGHDDVRVILPELAGVMRDISPLVSSLCNQFEMGLVEDEEQRPRERGHLPWPPRRYDSVRALEEAAVTQPQVSRSTQNLARDLAPLLDRLGRMMSDVAPTLAALGNTGREQGDQNDDRQNAEGAGRNSRALLRGLGLEPTRPRSPSPDSVFRRLVHVRPPLASAGSIDIHIHAIVPLRSNGAAPGGRDVDPSAPASNAQPNQEQGEAAASQPPATSTATVASSESAPQAAASLPAAIVTAEALQATASPSAATPLPSGTPGVEGSISAADSVSLGWPVSHFISTSEIPASPANGHSENDMRAPAPPSATPQIVDFNMEPCERGAQQETLWGAQEIEDGFIDDEEHIVEQTPVPDPQQLHCPVQDSEEPLLDMQEEKGPHSLLQQEVAEGNSIHHEGTTTTLATMAEPQVAPSQAAASTSNGRSFWSFLRRSIRGGGSRAVRG